jgi:hypothetical protein
MAFGDDVALFVVGWDAVWAVPCAVLTPDAAGIIVKNDTVVKFDIAVGRTSDETGGIDAVIAAHGVKQQEGIGETSPFHFSYTAPFDVSRIVILLIARHFAAAASDARRSIEVEAVLFPFIQRRDIDGVIATLHPRVGLVADEGFQWCGRGIHVIRHLLVFLILR